MTGIFSNDTYNNGVTRDNFEQYAHTYYNPRDPYNSDYLPSLGGTPNRGKQPPYNYNNNKSNKSAIIGVIFVLAIIIFVVFFSLKMYYSVEEVNYYQDKIDDANERLKILQDAEGQLFLPVDCSLIENLYSAICNEYKDYGERIMDCIYDKINKNIRTELDCFVLAK